MRLLDDITIYINDTSIKDMPADSKFRAAANYISDQYHRHLDKYKPPKTSRICIHLGPTRKFKEPQFFGSVCSIYSTIDEEKYLSSTKNDQYKYLLEIMHDIIIESGKNLDWELAPFEKSYSTVIKQDFKFVYELNEKKSRSRKNLGQVYIEKTEEESFLKVRLSINSEAKNIQLLSKKNWFWYDSIYKLAEKCKWIDNDKFGYVSKDQEHKAYFSIEQDKVISNIEFMNSDF